MNAGAYGSDWRSVLVDVVVAGAAGTRTLGLGELGLSYRHSGLVPGEVVARVRYRLSPKPSDAIKSDVADLLGQRKATQPTNKRTFGSVFKNPDEGPGAGAMIERSGLKGHRIGGAVISERHANFIENAGGATSADAVELMAEARRRVYEGFGVTLEHEVRFLGPLALPAL
jgi:UDP-N-acetylmuramate dehydrogenase